MHGYELITALEDRSGGRWKPSPGSIYPALTRLEQRGFVTSTEEDGKRRYELTDAGHERVEALRDAGTDAPWEEHGLGRHGDLRRAIAELVGPARQIGRFGSPDQVAQALTTVQEATAKLYRILAAGAADRAAGDDLAAEDGPDDL
jgi:DNA-binding PadR family transcriptional regulator